MRFRARARKRTHTRGPGIRGRPVPTWRTDADRVARQDEFTADLPPTTRQVVLASRARGALTLDSFRIDEVPLPAPEAGEVVVRNIRLGLGVVNVIIKNLTVQGLALAHTPHLMAEAPALFGQWLAEGMVHPNTVVDGGLDAPRRP